MPALRLGRLLLGAWLCTQATVARAESFDYYTFAISLTPAFCDQNPQRRDSLQCRDRLPLSVHGLWPERRQGRAPENCSGGPLALSPGLEKNLRGTMPDKGLREHQWKKHGRCSGLSPEAYFGLIDREFLALKWPEQLRPRGRDLIVERDLLLREIQRLNPGTPARGIVLRCARGGRPPLLEEVRLCLSPDGRPAECAANFRPNCPVAVTIRAP